MTTLADALAQIDVLARNGSGKCTGTDCTGRNLGRAHAVALELLGRVTEAAEQIAKRHQSYNDSQVHGSPSDCRHCGMHFPCSDRIDADLILAACRKEDTP